MLWGWMSGKGEGDGDKGGCGLPGYSDPIAKHG